MAFLELQSSDFGIPGQVMNSSYLVGIPAEEQKKDSSVYLLERPGHPGSSRAVLTVTGIFRRQMTAGRGQQPERRLF